MTLMELMDTKMKQKEEESRIHVAVPNDILSDLKYLSRTTKLTMSEIVTASLKQSLPQTLEKLKNY